MKIETELTNKEIEEALLSDLIQLWEVFSSLEGDEDFNIEFNKVKYGVNIVFDIRSITEGDFEKKVPFGEIWIERKQRLNITKYRDEIEDRKRIMKDLLRSLHNDSFDNQEEEFHEEYDQR